MFGRILDILCNCSVSNAVRLSLICIVFYVLTTYVTTIRYDISLSKSRFKGTHKCDTSACQFCPFATSVHCMHGTGISLRAKTSGICVCYVLCVCVQDGDVYAQAKKQKVPQSVRAYVRCLTLFQALSLLVLVCNA